MDDKMLIGKSHKLTMTNRKNGAITGVKDVISFDLTNILLETEFGMLSIKGHDLHVSSLSVDKGDINIDGTIDSFTYSDVNTYAKKSESFLNRLFK